MAVQKPLIIDTTGQIQRLQSGDSLEGLTPGSISLTNGNAGTIVIGSVVYMSAASTVDLAQSDALATSSAIGLVQDATILTAVAGIIQTEGILTATTGQWDAVTGQVGGLTFGDKYFIDPTTAGDLTITPPTTTGQVVALVGKAISTTEMQIEIGTTVLL